MEKWTRTDPEFVFSSNSSIHQVGGDHNIVSDANALALRKFLGGESRGSESANIQWANAKNEKSRILIRTIQKKWKHPKLRHVGSYSRDDISTGQRGCR